MRVLELLLLCRSSQLGQSVGLYAKAKIKVFEDGHPTIRRLKGDGQILPQIINGKRAPDALRQDACEEVDLGNLFHMFEIDQVFLDHAAQALPLPALPVT